MNKEIIQERVEKFLDQLGVECGGKEEKKLLKRFYPDDKLYSVWESSLVRFAEKLLKANQEDHEKLIKALVDKKNKDCRRYLKKEREDLFIS